ATCATDGMCATSCPVKINTGEMIKDLRHDHHGSLSGTIAMMLARNFALTARGARFGLLLANAGGELTRNAVRFSSTLLHRLTGGATPQLPFSIPIPHAAPPLPKPGRRRAAGRRAGAAAARGSSLSLPDAPEAKVSSQLPASEDPDARFVPGPTPDDESLNPQQSRSATTPDLSLGGDLRAASMAQ